MKPPHVLLLLGLVLIPRGVAGQETLEPGVFDPEAVLAQLEQRCLDAEMRIRAADLALAGAAPIEKAFPELAGAPLDSVAWVTGRLAELHERGKAYAAERHADPTPEDRPQGEETELSETEEAGTREEETSDGWDPLRAARIATHQALMEADEMERRFLLAVLVHLEENPQLTRRALASTRRDLTARVVAAEGSFADAGESSAEKRALRVVAAQQEVARLEQLQRGLLLHFTVGAPLPQVAADVDLLAESSGAEMAEFRLGLLLPFLGGEERAAVIGALARRQEVVAAAAAAVEAQAAQAVALSREESAAEGHAGLHNSAGIAEEAAREAQARLDQRRQELAEQVAGFREGLRDPEEERRNADQVYRDLGDMVRKMLRAIETTRSRSSEAARALAKAQSDDAKARVEIQRLEGAVKAGVIAPAPEAFEGWHRALERRKWAEEELAGLEQSHRDKVSALLENARALRRDLEGETSFKVVLEDLLDDLLAEASLIGPNMRALAGHRWSSVLELPSRLKAWNFAAALLIQIFWVLFVIVTCLGARRQVPRAVRGLLRRWTLGARRYAARDLRGMARPAERTLKALLDLAAGAVLYWLLADALPELGLVCLIYLQVALYRALLGLTSLAVARYPEVRPALLTLDPTTRDLLLTSVRVVVLWLIARQFARFFATRILAAVAFDEVLVIGFNVALVVLAVWLLHIWEPVLRGALQRRDPKHPLVVFLTHRQPGPFAALLALAHALAWGGLWTRDLLSRHVLQQAAAEDDSGQGARLPGEFVAQLLRRECPENGYVERPATREELDQTLGQWQAERRRGVVMLMGGQGAGKRTFVGRWCQALEKKDQPVVRIRLTERLTTSAGACQWLAKALSIEDPPTEPEALAGRVNEQLGGHVVVLGDLHFAFLRRVDGFAALRCLLSVVGSASSRIFWLLSMHRPGWHYLDSLGGFINTEACQRVIELEPFGETELRRLVEQRIAAADHEVGFSWLLPRRARYDVDVDPLALERITSEYYRRLAWVSQGKPAVALRLWRETLVPGRSDGRLEVARFVQAAALPALRDPDLFLLAAIYTHRALTEGELVAVTNMSPAQVNAGVRNLEARRVLTSRSKRFSLESRHLPAVTAELRRRHFVHGGA